MKSSKGFIACCVAVLMLAASSITAFAATYSTPAEAAAGVTGKTIEEVAALRKDGATYGKIAADADKLAEFHQAMQEISKETLDQLVADGTITQAEADELLAARAEQQANCDGTGNGGCGLGMGAGRGQGRGMGRGAGRGMGARGAQSGACIYR